MIHKPAPRNGQYMFGAFIALAVLLAGSNAARGSFSDPEAFLGETIMDVNDPAAEEILRFESFGFDSASLLSPLGSAGSSSFWAVSHDDGRVCLVVTLDDSVSGLVAGQGCVPAALANESGVPLAVGTSTSAVRAALLPPGIVPDAQSRRDMADAGLAIIGERVVAQVGAKGLPPLDIEVVGGGKATSIRLPSTIVSAKD